MAAFSVLDTVHHPPFPRHLRLRLPFRLVHVASTEEDTKEEKKVNSSNISVIDR